MPCNSDYLEPTGRERELQRAARLYCYVLRMMGRHVPADVAKASESLYCKLDVIPSLCTVIKSLELSDPELFGSIVYNPKSKESRGLADWWEEHLRADAEREALDRKQAANKAMALDIRSRLTPEQIAFLKNYGDIYL
jgi:hypothetical protein